MATEVEIIRGVSAAFLLGGWTLLSSFGIVLYFSLRGLPREVLGARLFLNLDKVGRGFLLLSLAFAVILLAAVPANVGVPGAPYIGLAGSCAWFVATLLSMYYLFKSLYVPRTIRKKFGAPS